MDCLSLWREARRAASPHRAPVRRPLPFLTLAAFPLAAALLAGPSRADITPAARRVVERYVDASGGRAAYESIHSLRTSASISAFGFKGNSTTWIRMPDRRATHTELGPFKISDGFDGSRAWRTDPTSGNLVILDGKDLEDAKASVYFDAERWLAPDQGGGQVAVADEKDSTGACVILQITPPVGRSRRFWFNQTTGLIDRMTTKHDQQTIVSILTDYRRAGSRMVAFHNLTQLVGMPANDLTVTLDSVAVNEAMADAMFNPPAQEAQAIRYLKTAGKAQLPFRYSGKHVWIKASVNGGEPADFIYDTGASITVIDSAYAAKIGLKSEGQMQAQGAGSSGGAAFSQLQSLRVAGPDGDGIELHDHKVAVLSVNPYLAPFFWRDTAGILGYDTISRFVNEIDFDNLQITLYDPKTFQYGGSGVSVPFTLAGTVPAMKMKIDGQYEGDFRLDVGSGSTVDLHGPFVKRYDLEKKVGKSLEVMGGGFGGMFTSQLTRMKKIEVGPYSWQNPIVSLSGATTGALTSEDYAGNVGNQILQRFKCTLDYERRVIYLEPGKRYSEPDRFSRVGVQLARYADTVKAMQVLPNSPAAKAGLKPGDRVVAIDGKPVLSYTPDDLEEMFEHGAVGRKVTFEVARGEKKQKLVMSLKEII